ncbi:MAG TPA: hypothetical protein VGD98_11185 [Ktedonobacteraceae bacterium]
MEAKTKMHIIPFHFRIFELMNKNKVQDYQNKVNLCRNIMISDRLDKTKVLPDMGSLASMFLTQPCGFWRQSVIGERRLLPVNPNILAGFALIFQQHTVGIYS